MDLSILDWFIVIVGMLLLVVLLDGYRRAQRGRRNQVRLSKNAKRLSKQSTANEKKFTAELPNGGARSVPQGAKQAKEPVVASGLSAQDDFTVEPELSSQESSPQPAFDEPEPLCEADALDPLFVDPFKSSLPQEQTVPSPSANAEDTSEQREEFQPCLFEGQAAKSAEQVDVEEIIVLNVLAGGSNVFSGSDLFHILRACDCRFGEMNIFHRYEQANEQGSVQFSIVNMVKPGTFNIQNSDDFSTPGVSFFIQLPGPADPIMAFDAMLETAKLLARNMNGELKDEGDSAATEQTFEHCREKIRTYQKKCLVRS